MSNVGISTTTSKKDVIYSPSASQSVDVKAFQFSEKLTKSQLSDKISNVYFPSQIEDKVTFLETSFSKVKKKSFPRSKKNYNNRQWKC